MEGFRKGPKILVFPKVFLYWREGMIPLWLISHGKVGLVEGLPFPLLINMIFLKHLNCPAFVSWPSHFIFLKKSSSYLVTLKIESIMVLRSCPIRLIGIILQRESNKVVNSTFAKAFVLCEMSIPPILCEASSFAALSHE